MTIFIEETSVTGRVVVWSAEDQRAVIHKIRNECADTVYDFQIFRTILDLEWYLNSIHTRLYVIKNHVKSKILLDEEDFKINSAHNNFCYVGGNIRSDLHFSLRSYLHDEEANYAQFAYWMSVARHGLESLQIHETREHAIVSCRELANDKRRTALKKAINLEEENLT